MTRVRPLARRRDGLCTTNVFSYPRLSRVNRRVGRLYFLFWPRAFAAGARRFAALLAAAFRRGSGAGRFFIVPALEDDERVVRADAAFAGGLTAGFDAGLAAGFVTCAGSAVRRGSGVGER